VCFVDAENTVRKALIRNDEKGFHLEGYKRDKPKKDELLGHRSLNDLIEANSHILRVCSRLVPLRFVCFSLISHAVPLRHGEASRRRRFLLIQVLVTSTHNAQHDSIDVRTA
jgi:hypothetical protein